MVNPIKPCPCPTPPAMGTKGGTLEAPLHWGARSPSTPMKELTLQEIKAIVLAEKAYWQSFDDNLAIGAVGACSNIYVALCGFPAPWHPNQVPENPPVVPDHGRELGT